MSKGDDTPKTEISNINYLVDKWFIFPLWLVGWYHLTDIQLFYLILVGMLKGTPVCNLYVFGLELSSKAIIITQRNTNTEAWYMITNFQHSETRNSKTNRRHSSINCKENKMQLSGTIKGNNSASGKMSSTTLENSLKPEKLLQLFFIFSVLIASSACTRDAASDKNFFLVSLRNKISIYWVKVVHIRKLISSLRQQINYYL